MFRAFFYKKNVCYVRNGRALSPNWSLLFANSSYKQISSPNQTMTLISGKLNATNSFSVIPTKQFFNAVEKCERRYFQHGFQEDEIVKYSLVSSLWLNCEVLIRARVEASGKTLKKT